MPSTRNDRESRDFVRSQWKVPIPQGLRNIDSGKVFSSADFTTQMEVPTYFHVVIPLLIGRSYDPESFALNLSYIKTFFFCKLADPNYRLDSDR